MRRKVIIIAFMIISTLFILVLGNRYYDNKISSIGDKAYAQYEEKQEIERGKLELEINNRIESLNELRDTLDEDKLEYVNQSQSYKGIFDKLNNGEKATIVFLGDSTTEQNKYTNGEPGHVELIKTNLSEIYGSNLNVINSGISGHTIKDMNDRLYDSVIRFNPDIVVINSGINDATKDLPIDEFEETYKNVIEMIEKETEAVITLRTSNPTMGYETNIVLEESINPIVKSLAEEYELNYIDLYSYYSDIVASDANGIEKYNYNYSHPNEIGQDIISDLVLTSFLEE